MSPFGSFCRFPRSDASGFSAEGNTIVGYIVLTIGFSFEFHGHDAFIDELYIDAAHRRRGFGRQAVEFLEKKAREIGRECRPSRSRPREMIRRSNSIAARDTKVTIGS